MQAVLHAVLGELERRADRGELLELGLLDHALVEGAELDDHVLAAEALHDAAHHAGGRTALARGAALVVELLKVDALEGGVDFAGQGVLFGRGALGALGHDREGLGARNVPHKDTSAMGRGPRGRYRKGRKGDLRSRFRSA